MISDITLGQYFPQKSPLHATDPRLKICLLVYAIVLLFAAGNFASLALAVVYIGLGIAFIPDFCLPEKESDLFVIRTREMLPSRQIVVGYNDKAPLSEAAQYFIDILV